MGKFYRDSKGNLNYLDKENNRIFKDLRIVDCGDKNSIVNDSDSLEITNNPDWEK